MAGAESWEGSAINRTALISCLKSDGAVFPTKRSGLEIQELNSTPLSTRVHTMKQQSYLHLRHRLPPRYGLPCPALPTPACFWGTRQSDRFMAPGRLTECTWGLRKFNDFSLYPMLMKQAQLKSVQWNAILTKIITYRPTSHWNYTFNHTSSHTYLTTERSLLNLFSRKT